MDDRLNFQVSKLSDAELHELIDNRPNYMPETVETAMAELKNRGIELDPEELQVVTEDLKAQRDNVGEQGGSGGFFNQTYKNNIVTDPFAPNLYSRKAVYGFTFFMGALFGSIMLAINAGKVRNTKGVWTALLFGVVFTGIQVAVVNTFHTNNSGSIFFGIISAFFSDYVLWPRVIGNEAFYRAKPIWVPLITAIVLGVLIVTAVIMSQGQV
jgi:hypothetical protein